MFFKINFLKKFAIFTGKKQRWSLFLIKKAGLKTLTQVFSYEYCEIFQNSFFIEHFRWPLLNRTSNILFMKITSKGLAGRLNEVNLEWNIKINNKIATQFLHNKFKKKIVTSRLKDLINNIYQILFCGLSQKGSSVLKKTEQLFM